MLTLDANDFRPLVVPSGYEFRAAIYGENGYWSDPSQLTLIYTRDWDPGETYFPLTVHVGSADVGALAGTEQRSGVSVKLFEYHPEAVYHDGIWAYGRGPGQRHVNGAVLFWSRSSAHSITQLAGSLTIAVRGVHSRGVSYEHLVRAMQSIPAIRT